MKQSTHPKQSILVTTHPDPGGVGVQIHQQSVDGNPSSIRKSIAGVPVFPLPSIAEKNHERLTYNDLYRMYLDSEQEYKFYGCPEGETLDNLATVTKLAIVDIQRLICEVRMLKAEQCSQPDGAERLSSPAGGEETTVVNETIPDHQQSPAAAQSPPVRALRLVLPCAACGAQPAPVQSDHCWWCGIHQG